MNKKEVVKGKNLFDEEKIIDTGIKEPLFVSIPFDEYKKLQEENEQLKEENFDQVYMKAIADYKDKIRAKIKELEKTKNYITSMYAVGVLEELLGDDE